MSPKFGCRFRESGSLTRAGLFGGLAIFGMALLFGVRVAGLAAIRCGALSDWRGLAVPAAILTVGALLVPLYDIVRQRDVSGVGDLLVFAAVCNLVAVALWGALGVLQQLALCPA